MNKGWQRHANGHKWKCLWTIYERHRILGFDNKLGNSPIFFKLPLAFLCLNSVTIRALWAGALSSWKVKPFVGKCRASTGKSSDFIVIIILCLKIRHGLNFDVLYCQRKTNEIKSPTNISTFTGCYVLLCIFVTIYDIYCLKTVPSYIYTHSNHQTLIGGSGQKQSDIQFSSGRLHPYTRLPSPIMTTQ